MSPSCPFSCVSLSLSRVRNFPLIHRSCTTPMYPLVAARTCAPIYYLCARDPLAHTQTHARIRRGAPVVCYARCRPPMPLEFATPTRIYSTLYSPLAVSFIFILLFIRSNKKFAHDVRRKITLSAKRVILRTARSKREIASREVHRNSLQLLSYLPRKISQDYILIRTVRSA